MKKLFLALFLLTNFSIFFASASFADSRVFTLINPNPEAVLQSLHNTYGDKISADIVQGRLLVVGSTQQLNEIAALLVKLDPAPRALRLTLSEHPSIDSDSDTKTNTYSTTYSTNTDGYTIDTVEGAFVSIDYQTIVQQPKANGWWITIDNVPSQFKTLSLQVHIEGGRRAVVLVNYAKQDNQERRVFGNTVVVDLGAWIPLLPRTSTPDDGTISSGPKAGEQLYLRVEKNQHKK